MVDDCEERVLYHHELVELRVLDIFAPRLEYSVRLYQYMHLFMSILGSETHLLYVSRSRMCRILGHARTIGPTDTGLGMIGHFGNRTRIRHTILIVKFWELLHVRAVQR